MSVQLPAATSDKFKKVRRLYDVQGFPGIASYALHPTNPWIVVCYHDGTFFVHNFFCTSMKPISRMFLKTVNYFFFYSFDSIFESLPSNKIKNKENIDSSHFFITSS